MKISAINDSHYIGMWPRVTWIAGWVRLLSLKHSHYVRFVARRGGSNWGGGGGGRVVLLSRNVIT